MLGGDRSLHRRVRTRAPQRKAKSRPMGPAALGPQPRRGCKELAATTWEGCLLTPWMYSAPIERTRRGATDRARFSVKVQPVPQPGPCVANGIHWKEMA